MKVLKALMISIFSFLLLLAAAPSSFAESNSENGDIPIFSDVPESEIISTENIDGTVVNTYSELPEEFILLNAPLINQSGIALRCSSCYSYKYTKTSGPTRVY